MTFDPPENKNAFLFELKFGGIFKAHFLPNQYETPKSFQVRTISSMGLVYRYLPTKGLVGKSWSNVIMMVGDATKASGITGNTDMKIVTGV